MTVYTSKGDALRIGEYVAPRPQAKKGFSVGVGMADITPPPGFPTGGDGPAGDVARGYWLRLRSRAFFFEDESGRTLALVSIDVFGLPAALRERVAQLVLQRHTDVSLPPGSLILAANHTHQGPGNFLSARLHNQFGSSYPGFDHKLFEFLADRIANSVSEAIVDARSHQGAVELKLYSSFVGYDMLMNRSPRTFMLNRHRDEIFEALNRNVPEPPRCQPKAGEASGGWEIVDCPRLRAVDRALTVLELRRSLGAETQRVGAMVFFAAHPTALDPQTPFYSPDFAGFAMRALESRLTDPRSQRVVVGYFNGAEGDITLRRQQRDILSARTFGLAFAANIADALQMTPTFSTTNARITVRTGEWFPARSEQARCGDAVLAWPPMIGAAMLGGAENDYTQLHDLGWREGVRDRVVDGHGPKAPAMDTRIIRGLRLSDIMMPADTFPESIPMTYAHLGPLQLAAVPTEMTTAQGYAVRRALGDLPHGRLEIIGLANEYNSYCSSKDEYAAQDYMGASTLWGPNEGAYLACRLAELSTGRHGMPTYHHTEREFWPGMPPRQPFGPSFVHTKITRPDEGLDRVLLSAKQVPERKLPWFEWKEDERGNSYETTVQRHVSIVGYIAERQCWTSLHAENAPTDGASRVQADNDQGSNFLTMYLGEGRWAAIWLRPLFEPNLSGGFAFHVVSNGAKHVSAPFAIAPNQPWPDRVHRESRAPTNATRMCP